MTGPIRVVIADDQPLFASGMRMLVDAQPDMECAGVAVDGASALEVVGETVPAILLLDLRMPGMNGIETMQRLFAECFEPPRVVVLTTLRRDDAVVAALRAGAAAFLTKDAEPEVVLGTIRDVDAGRPAPTESAAVEMLRESGLLDEPSGRSEILDVLSPREQEVFLLIAKGLSNTEIAASLYLSEATVKSHVRSVLIKLGLRNRIQVAITAHERGLVRA